MIAVTVSLVGCIVVVPDDGVDGPAISLTIANRSFVFKLGTVGVFALRAGSAPVEKAGTTVLFDEPASDMPVGATIELDISSVNVGPLAIPKVGVTTQVIGGSSDIRVLVADASSANPCTEGVEIGTYRISFAGGVATAEDASLGVPSAALGFLINGRFTVCLEATTTSDVNLGIEELVCVFGPVASQDGSCASDADCPFGFVCSGGRCEVAPAPQCITDTVCASDEVCDNGTCVLSPDDHGNGSGLDCRSNSECPDGEICSAEGCVISANECIDDFGCGIDERCIEGVCESGIGPDDLPTGFEAAEITHVGSEQIIVGSIADEAGGYGYIPEDKFGVTHVALSGDGLSLWFATKFFGVSNPPPDTQRLYHIRTDGRSLRRSPVPLDTVSDGTDPVFQRLATDDSGGVAILSVTRTVPPTIFGDTEAGFFLANPGLAARRLYDTTIETPEPQPGPPASPPRSLQVNNVGTHFSWNDEKNLWRYPINVENTVPALEVVISGHDCDFVSGKEIGEFDRSASDQTTILHFWSDPAGPGLCNTLLYAPPSATPAPVDLASTDYTAESVHVSDDGTLMAYCLCCGADLAQCYVHPPPIAYEPGAGFELTPASDTWNKFYDLVLADGGLRYRAVITDFVGTSDAVSFIETVGQSDRRMTGTRTFGAFRGTDWSSVQLSFDGSVMAARTPEGIYVLNDGYDGFSGFPSITGVAWGYDEESDSITFRIQAESDNGIDVVYALPMKNGIGPAEYLPQEANPFFSMRSGLAFSSAPIEGSTKTYEIITSPNGKRGLIDDSYALRFVAVDGTTSRTVFADIDAPQPPAQP